MRHVQPVRKAFRAASRSASVRSMWRLLIPVLLLSSAVAQSSIDSTEYQARRRAAMEKVPDGINALHSVSGLKHWDESGSHQDSSFFAFTGLANARGAILVLDGTEGKSWLFVMPRPKMFGPEFGSDLGAQMRPSWILVRRRRVLSRSTTLFRGTNLSPSSIRGARVTRSW